MNATELLKHHHAQLHATVKLLLKGDDHCRALLDKLATVLTAHMVIEQELFYPAGYEQTVAPGGAAITSGRAPVVAYA
jgi:hypothetical protein